MSVKESQGCLFCGGDASDPDHRCDGKQGEVEATLNEHPPEEWHLPTTVVDGVTTVDWSAKAPTLTVTPAREPFLFNPRWDDTPPLFVSGSVPATYATSEAAAVSVEDHRATQRREVHLVIIRAGLTGCTDEEVQDALGIGGSSERPRRVELWELGQITIRRDAAGLAVKRPTRTGRNAVVWIAVTP